MVRVSKQPEERREEIVATAEKLFSEKGFENTMMSDIAQSLGISQGLPYRYFKSKYDLLDAVIQKLCAEVMDEITAIAFHSGLKPKEALDQCLALVKSYAYSSSLIIFLHKEENLQMHQRISQASVDLLVPIFIRLIEQGNHEGCFHCPHPEIYAAFLLNGAAPITFWNDKDKMEENFDILCKVFYLMLGIR